MPNPNDNLSGVAIDTPLLPTLYQFPSMEEVMSVREVHKLMSEIKDLLQDLKGKTNSGIVINFNGMTFEEKKLFKKGELLWTSQD